MQFAMLDRGWCKGTLLAVTGHACRAAGKAGARWLTPGLGIAMLLASPLRTPAQTASETGPPRSNALEEIVVTATRREESLSKAPVSVVAFTQEDMDTKGIRDFTDIARYVPGVTIDTDLTNSITIRGVGSSGGAGTTGIYIDDTPIQMRQLDLDPDDALPQAFDLERVEILRGPQGTLFGAGSEGGTVRYIFKQPSLTESSSYARSEVADTRGGQPSYEAGFATGGPISEGKLGFRASAWFRHDGGWIDRVDPYDGPHNVIQKGANYADSAALRAALTWAPIDSVTITPSVYYQHRYHHDLSIWWPALSNPNSDHFADGNPTTTPQPDTFRLFAVKVEAGLGPTRLIANSSYFSRREQSGVDYTQLIVLPIAQTLVWPGSSFPYAAFNPAACPTFNSCYPLVDGKGLHLPPALQNLAAGPLPIWNRQDNLTQEVRWQSNDPAARVVWTVGAFFSVIRQEVIDQSFFPHADAFYEGLFGQNYGQVWGAPLNPDGSTALLPGGSDYRVMTVSHERQVAEFGEVTVALSDRLKVIAGLRRSQASFEISNNSFSFISGTTTFNATSGETPVTPRAGLTFQIDPDNLLYTTYSKGFRLGGANQPIQPGRCDADYKLWGIPGEPPSFKSDYLNSYEVGLKDNFADRVRLESSIYYSKWNGIQEGVLLPLCQARYTANLGQAAIKGFDVQGTFAIGRAFTLETALGYLDAKFTQTLLPGPLATTPIVFKGDSLLGLSNQPASPLTVTVGGQYNFRAFARPSYARFDYEYHSKDHNLNAPEDPRTLQYDPFAYTPAVTKFLSLRAGSSFGAWAVSAFVDNVFDTHTTFNYDHTITDYYNPGVAPGPLWRNNSFRPRVIGLTMTYRK